MSEDASAERFGDAVREFERLIDRRDVSIATGEDELVAEFESIVERYDAVRSDLEELKSGLPTDEDGGFTAEVFAAEEPIDRWRDRHPEHVTAIQELFEDYRTVFEQVDIEDPDTEPTEGSDSDIGALLNEITVWKTVLESTEE